MNQTSQETESFKELARAFLSAIEKREEARIEAGKLIGKLLRDFLNTMDAAEENYVRTKTELEHALANSSGQIPIILMKIASDFLDALEELKDKQDEASRLQGPPFRDFQKYLEEAQNSYDERLRILRKNLNDYR